MACWHSPHTTRTSLGSGTSSAAYIAVFVLPFLLAAQGTSSLRCSLLYIACFSDSLTPNSLPYLHTDTQALQEVPQSYFTYSAVRDPFMRVQHRSCLHQRRRVGALGNPSQLLNPTPHYSQLPKQACTGISSVHTGGRVPQGRPSQLGRLQPCQFSVSRSTVNSPNKPAHDC